MSMHSGTTRRASHRNARLARREFILAFAAAAVLWPSRALAQDARKPPLIGLLNPGTKAATEEFISGFPRGMSERGYLEGRDYALEARYADANLSRLPRLAEELIRLKPDLIMAATNGAALAAKQATASIPIVGVGLIDPVGVGLVASEARPGNNVTGTLQRVEGLTGKQLEIALDVMPGASRIGMLVNPDAPTNPLQREEVEAAAAKLAVNLVPVEVRSGDGIGPAFQTFARERASIVLVLADSLLLAERRQIAAFALASRTPTVYSFREHVDAGGLISYGISLRANYRRSAYFVDRIFKGARPQDLPIEFPTKLELVVNLATAKAIGLEIPPAVIVRADVTLE
jgi:putative ABC transport system substrate-binding protein